jgi:hypothetical protein
MRYLDVKVDGMGKSHRNPSVRNGKVQQVSPGFDGKSIAKEKAWLKIKVVDP